MPRKRKPLECWVVRLDRGSVKGQGSLYLALRPGPPDWMEGPWTWSKTAHLFDRKQDAEQAMNQVNTLFLMEANNGDSMAVYKRMVRR